MKKKMVVGLLAASLSLTMTGCSMNPLGDVVAIAQKEAENPTQTAPAPAAPEENPTVTTPEEETEEETPTTVIGEDDDEKDDEKEDKKDDKDEDELDSSNRKEDKKDDKEDEEEEADKDEDSKKDDKDDEDKDDKKDDNKQDSSTADASGISDDWTDMEIILDGTKYTFPIDYADLEAAGWTLNLEDYGYEDGYMLNPGDKTYSTVDLYNSKYDEDMTFWVGFTNVDDKAKDITECSIWSITMDTCYGSRKLDNVPDMVMAKGIHIGSTEQDVIDAYGECDDVYDAGEDYGYKTYSYNVDSYYLELTIYENEGVTKIDLSSY